MSLFFCGDCSTPIIEINKGYITECEHYLKDYNIKDKTFVKKEKELYDLSKELFDKTKKLNKEVEI